MRNKLLWQKLIAILMAVCMFAGMVPSIYAEDTGISVSWELTNITVSPQVEKINEGESLSVTLSARNGFALPKSISVSGATEYSYSPDNGELKIDAENISGDIRISADGVREFYIVSWNLLGIVTPSEESSKIPVSSISKWSVTLEPMKGFSLPASVSVQDSNGSSVSFSYNSKTGNLSIQSYSINDDLTITAEAKRQYYLIDWSLMGIKRPSVEQVKVGNGLDITLEAEQDYALPAEVIVTDSKGNTVEASYVQETGALCIDADKISSDLTIHADAEREYYRISWVLTGAVPPSVNRIRVGEKLEVILEAEENFALPAEVIVSDSKGNAVEASYVQETGALSIDADKIIDDLTVRVDAIQEYYSITWQLTGIKTPSVGRVATGEGLNVILEAEENYSLPGSDAISVLDGNGSPVEFSYDPETGELIVEADQINDDLVIKADAKREYYCINWKLNGITVPSVEKVRVGESLIIDLEAEENYSLPDKNAISVTDSKNNTVFFLYSNNSGRLTIQASRIKDDLTIEINANREYYSVSWALVGVKVPSITKVRVDNDLVVILEPEEKFSLPDTVTVTDSKGSVVNANYDPESGSLEILAGNINNDLTVEAEAERIYPISFDSEAIPDWVREVKIDGATQDLSNEIWANSGCEILISVEKEHYSAQKLFFTEEGAAAPSEAEDCEGSFKFSMPAADVVVSVKWVLVSADFSVHIGSDTLSPYIDEDEKNWYPGECITVKPAAPADQISTEEDEESAAYADSLEISAEGHSTFYLSENGVEGRVQAGLYLDHTAPSANVYYSSPYAASDEEKELLSCVRFNEFAYSAGFLSGNSFTIEAKDTYSDSTGSEAAGSGVKSIKYIVMPAAEYKEIHDFGSLSESGSYPVAAEELAYFASIDPGAWKAYKNPLAESDYSKDKEYVLLLRLEDNVGNVSFARYFFVFQNFDKVSVSLVVAENSKEAPFEDTVVKSGNTYYIKGNGSADKKVLIYFIYRSNSSSLVPDNRFEVFNGGKEWLSDAVEKSNGFTRTSSLNHSARIILDIAGLPDGEYSVSATAHKTIYQYFMFIPTGQIVKDFNASPVRFVLSRSVPSATLTYSGMNAYDEADGSTVKYAICRSSSSAIKENTGVGDRYDSNKVLYVNASETEEKKVRFSIAFNKEESYPLTTSISVNGKRVTKSNGAFLLEDDGITIDANAAAEGEYIITFGVTNYDGTVKEITAAKLIVDNTPPAAKIKARSYTEAQNGTRTYLETLKSGKWSNTTELVELMLYSMADVGGLPEDCVFLSEEDEYISTTLSTRNLSVVLPTEEWTWSGTISGDQDKKYTLTLRDKTGNTSVLTFTVRIDSSAPDTEHALVFAKAGSNDAAYIADQFSFGVFHRSYQYFSIDVKDSEEGVTVSGLRSVDYCYLKSSDPAFRDLLQNTRVGKDGKEETVSFSFDELKHSEELRAVFLKNEEELAPKLKKWKPCTKNGLRYETALISKNTLYVLFVKVTDNAGNISYIYRNVIITDSESPQVKIVFHEPDLKTDSKDSRTAYSNSAYIDLEITEPNVDSSRYSGINSVSYIAYYGGDPKNVLVEKTLQNLYTDLSDAEKGAVSDSELSDYLIEQGDGVYKATLTINGASKDLYEVNDIVLQVSVQDLAGNKALFESESFTIDALAPRVKVSFNKLTEDDGCYPDKREAEIFVTDSNFSEDKIVIKTNGELGEWELYNPDGKNTAAANGERTYKATLTFNEDLDYEFKIESVADAFGTSTKLKDIEFENCANDIKFIVDTVAPSVLLNKFGPDNKYCGDYSNTDVTVTLSASDKNLAGATVDAKKDGVTFPLNLGIGQTREGQISSRVVTEEGSYELIATAVDQSGRSDSDGPVTFVIDKTKPVIEIENVIDGHAYNNESVTPLIRIKDTNFAKHGVNIVLDGANSGEVYNAITETDINGSKGEEYLFANIRDDDLYTLTVTAEDEAGNIEKKVVHFSVNRNGSVFTCGDEIAKAIKASLPYFRSDDLPPVQVVETNVDLIKSAKVYLTRDNVSIDLEEGKDYSITRKDVNGGWSQYVYELNHDLFLEDGVYRVSLMTTDAAGNSKMSESILAFIVDNTPPVLIVPDLESAGVYDEASKYVSFVPNDNLLLSEIRVILNGEELAVWNSETIAHMIQDGETFAFEIPQRNTLQSVQIILTDAAGNKNENQMFSDILVSTNIFVRFFMNKPLFYGTVGGLCAAGGILWIIIARIKKKKKEAREQDLAD